MAEESKKDNISEYGENRKRRRTSDTSDTSPPTQAAVLEAPDTDKQEGDEARKRILDAAQCLFAAHGFSATTTKAIAQKARVPGGLIFYYFPTKKALLETIIDERSLLVELRAAVNTTLITEPRAALTALGKHYLTILKQHEELARIIFREFRSYPEVAEEMHTLREEHVQLITSYLQKILQDGQYSLPHSIQTIARMFFYNCLMISVIEDMPDPVPFIEDMAGILLSGCATRCFE